MQVKLNIVLKLAKEVGLTVVQDSPFKAIEAISETDRLRLSFDDIVEEYGIVEELCDTLTQSLNELKKKSFELKILESGRAIESPIELKELKSRGVEKLISIPSETISNVRAYERQILSEQEYLGEQRKKSKETIVEEQNLLPNLNFRVGISLLLTLFASIFVVLGYIASTDERFYDKDFGYWSMLIGGLGLLITLNLLAIRVVQAVRFQINKTQAIEDLAVKYMDKLTTNYEALEGKLRSKIFGIESVVYVSACKIRFSECKIDYKELSQKVAKHFK